MTPSILHFWAIPIFGSGKNTQMVSPPFVASGQPTCLRPGCPSDQMSKHSLCEIWWFYWVCWPVWFFLLGFEVWNHLPSFWKRILAVGHRILAALVAQASSRSSPRVQGWLSRWLLLHDQFKPACWFYGCCTLQQLRKLATGVQLGWGSCRSLAALIRPPSMMNGDQLWFGFEHQLIGA